MQLRPLALTVAGAAAIAGLGWAGAAALADGSAPTLAASAPASASEAAATVPTTAPSSSASPVNRGHYLAQLGDCDGCHTAPGGRPFAGGLPIDTGFGKIYTPNITSDRDTGIGGWSKDDFYRAMHTGHDEHGRHLYPAFPYPWYTKVTREDSDALKDYFDSVAAVHQANKPPELPWWMSWRGLLAGWNLLWFDEGTFQADAQKSAQWNRGAYLVEGLGHCGDCHTPKGYFGGAHRSEALAGGNTAGGHDNGWFAPSLRGERRAGLGTWSEADIALYLKTGANARTAAYGPMAEAVTKSTRFFSDDDLAAVATYLKSLAPLHEETTPLQTLDAQAMERGKGLFVDNCAACHMDDGKGLADVFPALAGSSSVQAAKPASLVRIVLEGGVAPPKPGQGAYLAMPAFGRKLDDREVADVVDYVRNTWGNSASVVDADAVAKARKELAAVQGVFAGERRGG